MRKNTTGAVLYSLLGFGAAYALRSAARRGRPYELFGKKVLITGGSRGLGLVMAREFVRQGAQVAICERDTDELERAAADLAALGSHAVTVPCDITDPAQVQSMVRSVLGSLGTIDVLVNNAGVIEVGPAELMTLADYEEAMRVNFWGPLYTTLEVLDDMRRRRSGRIINISSFGGKISVPHLLPYCASKFAFTGFSEGLRAAFAKDNIVVTTVCPGLMRTGSSTQHAMFKGRHRAEFAWFNISAALPFLSMSAEEAARSIIAASKRGDAALVLTIPAKFGVLLHALFPEQTSDVLSLANRLLPGPGGIGTQRKEGKETGSFLSSSWLKVLNQAAAHHNERA